LYSAFYNPSKKSIPDTPQSQMIGKPGITFIRYTQSQMIGKSNNLKVL
jgi:hypothetical protein